MAVWAAIYLVCLGRTEFKGEEGRRVFPALRMLQNGNWLVPELAGMAYSSKPPMINWLVASSFLLTGERSEFSARLPSVISLLALVSLIIWMPSAWLSVRARFLAALVFLTNIGLMEKGRQIELEALYLSLTGLAVVWWLGFWSRRGSRWGLWIMPGLFMGMGLLTKGPICVLCFYAVAIGVLTQERRLRELLHPAHWLGIALMAVLSLGWIYLARQQASHDAVLERATSEVWYRLSLRDLDFGQWAREFPSALVKFLPWLIFIPMLWMKRVVGLIPAERLAIFKGCRWGMVVPFVLVLLIPHTMARYTFPVFPVASLLLGYVLSLPLGPVQGAAIWRRVLLAGIPAAAGAGALGLILVTHEPWVWVAVAASIAAACGLLKSRGSWTAETPNLVLALGLLIALWGLQFAVFGTTIISARQDRRSLGREIAQAVPAGNDLYAYNLGFQGYLFYVTTPVRYLQQPEQITPAVHYLLVRDSDWARLESQPVLAQRPAEALYQYEFSNKGKFRVVHLGSKTNQR